MKNIFKSSSLLVVLLVLFSNQAFAQIPSGDNVISFVHGFNGSERSFNVMDDYLNDRFRYVSVKKGYRSNFADANAPSVSQIAGSLYNPIEEDSYVVAHSLGGLIARESIRRGKGISGLVTLGTPHKGAPMAGIGPYRVSNMVLNWAEDLFNPIEILINTGVGGYQSNFNFGAVRAQIDNEVVYLLVAMAEFFNHFYKRDFNRQIGDLQPNSNLMRSLNSNVSRSLPPRDRTWFLWSNETWNSPVRTLESKRNSGIEHGYNDRRIKEWASFYAIMSSASNTLYRQLRLECIATGEIDPCFDSMAYLQVSLAFAKGSITLSTGIQKDWSRVMMGGLTADIHSGGTPDDGVVPVRSQYPRYSGYSRNKYIKETNHLEQRLTAEAKLQVASALRDLGIDTR